MARRVRDACYEISYWKAGETCDQIDDYDTVKIHEVGPLGGYGVAFECEDSRISLVIALLEAAYERGLRDKAAEVRTCLYVKEPRS